MKSENNYNSTDLTFFTNEPGATLLDRFKNTLSHVQSFDVLVGYFYTSGFHAIYKSLNETDKIRILIGISTNRQTFDYIQQANTQKQQSLQFSHKDVKDKFTDEVTEEFENSADSHNVEEGVLKFIEWLKNGKLAIKAYPSENIHAKVYIMTLKEGSLDSGRVITGSSNFTKAGLEDNLEFNVELKNRSDYEFAQKKFNDLWENAVDVTDKYVDTIQTKTWLNDNILPYELYLKFLYEYFKDEISKSYEDFFRYTPPGFKKLEYQELAVLNAKKILEEYGGVFLSDVVGLGKTYMGAMLANQLDGRHLVIAPPALLDKNNPGSWRNVFTDFRVPADFESLGQLDRLVKLGTDKYKNIFIDEAHRFRTETNETYEKLAEICRGKRVILVTATPYNNSPKDILSQVKLFQPARKSSIPNLADLESFFSKLDKKLKGLDRQKDRGDFIRITKENAKEIREKVLNYLMVRRTRKEIQTFFGKDLKSQGLKFPEVAEPEAVFYELNPEEDRVFNQTMEFIIKDFNYARYTPLLYLQDKLSQPESVGQKNMGKFMKILLVKRLESSFYAFRNSIGRFINSYEIFIKEFERGNVYFSKKHANKIFELLENDNDAAIQKLIDSDKATVLPAEAFNKKFIGDLKSDLAVLNSIKDLWGNINRDPKLLKFIDILKSNRILKKNKLIIFTESKETADYLEDNLNIHYPGEVLKYTGQSGEAVRKKVIDNFDAKSTASKDHYRILIATEVLAEGVNLHASNVVINYDIPWNPTRLRQRVGRINRVDTKFNKIYTFNFFPTEQANEQIKLQEAAEAKIEAFISLLGADAKLLTDGEEPESHELFHRLTSKSTITDEDGDEESELKYQLIIKDIRDKDPDLFNRIKKLPKKARTARKHKDNQNALLTYFRKGKLHKFFLSGESEPKELDFISAAKLLAVKPKTKREKVDADYYKLLDKNKLEFEYTTTEELLVPGHRSGRDSSAHVLKILKVMRKDVRQLTDDQEDYLKKVISQIEKGAIPKQTAKKLKQELQKELKKGSATLKLLAVIQKNLPPKFLEEHLAETAAQTAGPREVILSEYLIGE